MIPRGWLWGLCSLSNSVHLPAHLHDYSFLPSINWSLAGMCRQLCYQHRHDCELRYMPVKSGFKALLHLHWQHKFRHELHWYMPKAPVPPRFKASLTSLHFDRHLHCAVTGTQWTSIERQHGWRHFRVVEKRRDEQKATHVLMASTCDKEVRFWVRHFVLARKLDESGVLPSAPARPVLIQTGVTAFAW